MTFVISGLLVIVDASQFRRDKTCPHDEVRAADHFLESFELELTKSEISSGPVVASLG
jgi:hypothetical protein